MAQVETHGALVCATAAGRRSGRRPHAQPAPSLLSARAVNGLRMIDPGEWDALVPPGSAPLRHGYLTAWEQSELAGLCSCPVAAYKRGSPRPVAACPGYFYELDLIGVRIPAAARPMELLRRIWPRTRAFCSHAAKTARLSPLRCCLPSLRG